MRRALLFEKLEEGKTKCTACAHYCTVKPGGIGICGARRNVSGQLMLLVYGMAASVNIDPIEKKPLFHFLPGTRSLSLGTLGCNFQCDFCQNWDISQGLRHLHSDRTAPMTSHEADRLIAQGQPFEPAEIVERCTRYHIPHISYTYNEPSIFLEYALDTAQLAHEQGIRNVFVSNGFMSAEALGAIRPYLDGINVDLKSFSEGFYAERCQAQLKPVLESISRLHQLGVWVEVTTLVIPGENDSERELKQVAAHIASVSRHIPWHLTAFHPDYRLQDKPQTPVSSLLKAYDIGWAAGLQHVYLGNILDEQHSATYCPACGELLISRDWQSVVENRLTDGKCFKCNRRIPGVWR